MAREVGFEPTTTGLEDRCSIQLSYSRNIIQNKCKNAIRQCQSQLSIRVSIFKDFCLANSHTALNNYVLFTRLNTDT